MVSCSRLEEEGLEEPLSYRRQRNKKAEKELHHLSENLSHRLEELDQVCVCVCIRSEHIVMMSSSQSDPFCMCVSVSLGLG